MECSRDANKRKCTCTYSSCGRRGICCECVEYHRSRNELPGCLFSPEAEKTYDRSYAKFVSTCKNK